MLRSLVIVIVLTLSSAATPQDHRPTLPELARRSAPAPLFQSRSRELVIESVESIVRKSDLIVYGRIGSVRTHLSRDQRDLYTDAVFEPIQVVLHRVPTVSPRPGQLPIILRRWGGETVIDGVQVIQQDTDLRQFEKGEQLVLFLQRDADDGVYRLVSFSSASFEVSGGRTVPVARIARGNPLFNHVASLELLVSEVRRVSR